LGLLLRRVPGRRGSPARGLQQREGRGLSGVVFESLERTLCFGL